MCASHKHSFEGKKRKLSLPCNFTLDMMASSEYKDIGIFNLKSLIGNYDELAMNF